MKKHLIVFPIVVAVAVAAPYLGLTSRTVAPSNVLRISGNIEVKDVDLSFNIAGKTTARLVSEGMIVKADQVVATLDTDELEHELEPRRAESGAARAEIELTRQKEFRDQDVISSHEGSSDSSGHIDRQSNEPEVVGDAIRTG